MLVRVAIIAAAIAAVIAIPASASPPDPFQGPWVGTEEGVDEHLVFGVGGPEHQVSVRVDPSGVCRGGMLTAKGTGSVDGDTLTSILDVRCDGKLVADDVTVAFEHDPGTGTLSDSIGATWVRPSDASEGSRDVRHAQPGSRR